MARSPHQRTAPAPRAQRPLSFLEPSELRRAHALYLKINEVRRAKRKPSISFVSAFEGLVYQHLNEHRILSRFLFTQLKDDAMRGRVSALQEEVDDATHAPMGKLVYRFAKATREADSSPDFYEAGEVCGVLKQSDYKVAKAFEVLVNDARARQNLPKYDRASILFGFLAARFIDASTDATGNSFLNSLAGLRGSVYELLGALEEAKKVFDAQRHELRRISVLAEEPATATSKPAEPAKT